MLPLLLGLVCSVQTPSLLAQQVAPGSISALLQVLTPGLTNIVIPSNGTVGQFSLTTLGNLPLLSSIKLPIISSFGGAPVIGNISSLEGLDILESITPLQLSLPGLASTFQNTLLNPASLPNLFSSVQHTLPGFVNTFQAAFPALATSLQGTLPGLNAAFAGYLPGVLHFGEGS